MALPLPRPSSFRDGFAQQRATRKARPPRTPLLARAGRLAARVLPTWQTVRTTTLSVAGFGAISYGAYEWIEPLGYAAAGVSLLLIEYLTSSGGSRT